MASRLIWIFQIRMCPPTLSSDFDETKRSSCAFICVRLIFCIKLPLIGPFFFCSYSSLVIAMGCLRWALGPPWGSNQCSGGLRHTPLRIRRVSLCVVVSGAWEEVQDVRWSFREVGHTHHLYAVRVESCSRRHTDLSKPLKERCQE